MQWLPPTYRLILTKELSGLALIEKALNDYVDEGCLFCVLEDTPTPIARVVNIQRHENKLCLWLDEIKIGVFSKKNLQYFVQNGEKCFSRGKKRKREKGKPRKRYAAK